MKGIIISVNAGARTVEIKVDDGKGILDAELSDHINTANCTVDSECSFDGTPESGYMLIGVIKAA